jgi:hypothetical protein
MRRRSIARGPSLRDRKYQNQCFSIIYAICVFYTHAGTYVDLLLAVRRDQCFSFIYAICIFYTHAGPELSTDSKFSYSMCEKLALIIEQISALNPLKLRTTNAGIQNGLYYAICARFDWSSHEDRSLVLCLGWLSGYLQGQIFGAYREYQ